jgi:hypothetical protein
MKEPGLAPCAPFLLLGSADAESLCYGQPEKIAKIEMAMNPCIRIALDGLRE